MKTRIIVWTFVAVAVLWVGRMVLPQFSSGRILGMMRYSSLTISVNRNDPVTVAAEVNSDKFRKKLSQGTRSSAWRLNRLKITFTGDDLSSYTFSPPVREDVAVAISTYLGCRADGHSSEYCYDVLQLALNGPTVNIDDPYLKSIASEKPLLPLAWMQKIGSSTHTNIAGQVSSVTKKTSVVDGRTVVKEIPHIPDTDEIYRTVVYQLVDGDLGWNYFVRFNPDGSVGSMHFSRFDAIEVSPQYEKIIDKVKKEVNAEMKQEGIDDQFGSIHTFWYRIKERLANKEIMWRSPAELNPHITYD